MQKRLAILILLFSVRAFGQVSTDISNLKNLGVTKVDSISFRDILGDIYSSDGFAGFVIKLDSTMTFKTTNFTCMSSSEIDSGTWSIENRNTIILKSTDKVLRFDVLEFDHYYFFIDQSERNKFVTDFLHTKEHVRVTKPLKNANEKHSENYFIWHFLKRDYYTKEIDLKSGI